MLGILFVCFFFFVCRHRTKVGEPNWQNQCRSNKRITNCDKNPTFCKLYVWLYLMWADCMANVFLKIIIVILNRIRPLLFSLVCSLFFVAVFYNSERNSFIRFVYRYKYLLQYNFECKLLCVCVWCVCINRKRERNNNNNNKIITRTQLTINNIDMLKVRVVWTTNVSPFVVCTTISNLSITIQTTRKYISHMHTENLPLLFRSKRVECRFYYYYYTVRYSTH